MNLNDFLHGVWIGPRVNAGKGLSLGHPRGIVINPTTTIGNYCTIINQVTLGGPEVTLEDFVEIGAGAKLLVSEESLQLVEGIQSLVPVLLWLNLVPLFYLRWCSGQGYR